MDEVSKRFEECVAAVVAKRHEFVERNYPDQVVGFSEIELKKIELADVVLDLLGLGRDPSLEECRVAYQVRRDAIQRLASPELRARVISRVGAFCVDCGSDDGIAIDHVVPHARGGLTVEGNLTVRCRRCNSSKGAQWPQ